jgi:uncharacterized protein
MEKKKFRIGRAPLGGLGLFATEIIPKGERFLEYVGERITHAEANTRGGKYLFEVNTRTTIDGTARSNVARYINHSCVPNAEAEIERGRVFIQTKRKILPGEEICYNYGKEYYDEFLKGVCRCPKCSAKRAIAK